ncbi:hypothetical protein [Anaerolentibacter hominis]|uniref:hypothetical protein n=1 Tax=Anaerolentibacter hominis TaxID=3079009 RepID=UPI0031B89D9D
MNGNTELLNYIYQNSQMGVLTISQLLEIVTDKEFQTVLKEQLREYKIFHHKSKELLNQHGLDEKGLSRMEKVRTNFMIDIQTMNDKSSNHIAEMMMTGSTMGIINALRNSRKYKDAEKNILDLMKNLLHMEEKNFEELKKFV